MLVRSIRIKVAFGADPLNPGETKTVDFKIKGSDLAFVGYNNKWRLEEGEFIINSGDLSLSINCDKTKVWETPNK